MRRQFIAQTARRVALRVADLLAQVQHLAYQRVNLRLLADHRLVQLVQQVFGKAGFDFQGGQARFARRLGRFGGGGVRSHPAIVPSVPELSCCT